MVQGKGDGKESGRQEALAYEERHVRASDVAAERGGSRGEDRPKKALRRLCREVKGR